MKTFFGIFLSFCLLLAATMPVAPKADAAVGLIMKSRSTATIGGLAAGGGTLFSTIVYGMAIGSGATGWASLSVAIAASVYIAIGLTVAVVGIVVLDDKTAGDFKFLAIENKNHDAAIDIYNSELDMLNAIKERIEADYDNNPEVDTKALWQEYGQALSPETMGVAQAIADGIVKQLVPVNQ